MRFDKEIEILNSREYVWQFLWDIDRFITCVPGCREAKTVEAGKQYTATMVEKVGPFRVEFPMRIDILHSEHLAHIKAQASGNDSKVGSRMKVDLEVHLRDKAGGDGMILSFAASVDILGKLATLGHSIMKRKADQVMDEFARALKARLEEVAGA